MSLNNQSCQPTTTLIDLNPDEPHYYPIAIRYLSVVEAVTLLMIGLLEYELLIRKKI